MDAAAAIAAFTALFVIIDPVGKAPLFVALTQGLPARERRGIAIRACLIGLGLSTLFGLTGEAALDFLGISMPAFRMAGGILLFLTALDMLFDRRRARNESQAEAAEADDPSVFPLAIPLIAGPGAITTMILLAGAPRADTAHIAMIHGVMVLVLLCVFAAFLLAGPLERLLGPVGINVVTRLLGMLLAALSVQFVIDGLRDLQVI